MKCLIPGRFVKLFGRAIHCLSKIGDELYIEASLDGLALRTVNSSRSAFGCFLFNESFFHEYVSKKGGQNSKEQEDDIERFKISMKSCLGVFKSLNTIEKNVDTCTLEYDEKETRLVFKLFCRHGIVKTHNLTFQESENLQAVFSKDLCPNIMAAGAKVLIDTAANFPNNCEEITLSCTPESIIFKNYLEDEPDPSTIVHTEMKLHPEEFDNYQIGVDTDITFCLKEARAVLSFADFVAQPVSIHFSTCGKPVVFSLDGDSLYEADFVLATLMEQSMSSQISQQYEASTSRENTKATVRHVNRKKTKGAAPCTRTSTTDEMEIHNETNLNNDQIDLTMDEDLPITRRLDSVKTPSHTTDNTSEVQTKSCKANIGLHAGEDDDFFSESFPYKEMLGRNAPSKAIGELNEDSGLIPADSQNQHINSQRTSKTDDMSPRRICMPNVGDSESVLRDFEGIPADSPKDDVLLSTPPSKKFKSLFFGTVTGPAEIKRKRYLHETVLAADTDDES